MNSVRRFFSDFVSDLRRYPALCFGVCLATLLFACLITFRLNFLSVFIDNPAVGYDYFTLPRCGLAARFGTSLFTSAADYKWYGPWATQWVTHPMLCLAVGVPLSYLAPFVGYWLLNVLYYFLHIWILWRFGRQIFYADAEAARQVKTWVLFGALGFFFPWYVMYYYGQYHAFAVFAFALLFLGDRGIFWGFTLSAFGKPLLAPAALVLLVRRKWSLILKLTCVAALSYFPFAYLTYDDRGGLQLGLNKGFQFFLDIGSKFSKYTVFRWNQQNSLSAVLDEFMLVDHHYYVRLALALIPIFTGAILFSRKKIELALGVTVLWYFFLYARGHEYHATLYLPLLLFLYAHNKSYRNWFFVSIAVLLALPTVYPLFGIFYGLDTPKLASSDAMYQVNPWLYFTFLLHKPLCNFLLLGHILKTELNPNH